MRISGNTNIDFVSAIKVPDSKLPISESVVKQGSKTTTETPNTSIEQVQQVQSSENNDETKAKVKDAVSKLNDMLDVTNQESKFMYHEGLDRYYVTVVNRETEEVVKEIPPKKLLDAFYEMQKMLGMIVDEKI